MGWVYLLHIDPPYRHARHYWGYTSRDDVESRVEEHRTRRGARLCEVAVSHGCQLHLALVLPGTRADERRLKKASRATLYCPICRGWIDAAVYQALAELGTLT